MSRITPKLLHTLALPLQFRAKNLELSLAQQEVFCGVGSHNYLCQGKAHKALCLGQMELLTWLSRTSHQIIAATICSCCNHQSILKSASILHVTSFGWKCRVELCHPPPPSLGHQCDHTWFSVSVLAVTGADPPWDEGQRLCAWAQRQLPGHLKQEVQINLSSWNYRGNLGRQNAISQDTEVNTVNLVESAMGPLITATGQGLSFMSHPKDGTSQWALGLLWLEEESSATYCNTVTSPNTWAHLEGVTSFLDHLKN